MVEAPPAFPLAAVRSRFPALAGESPPVFFDNPAGCQLPGSVAEAMAACARESCANLGGYFATSRRAGEIVQQAHADAALLLGAASAGEVALGASMTELTYHVSRACGRMFAAGDEILVTSMDHEGNVSPWLQAAEDFGLTVRWLAFDPDSWRIEPEALRLVLSERTRLLALGCASNLTGSLNHVQSLARIAHEAGVLVYADAVQYAPHRLMDVQALECDFLVFSAYKCFGPHIAALWGREQLLDELPAYRLRCGPQQAAAKFERGTPQVELHAGLSASIDYLLWLGAELGANGGGRPALQAAFAAAQRHEEALAARLLHGLAEIPGATIHGLAGTGAEAMARRVPTVSLTHERVSSRALAQGLAQAGIHAWSGHNYAYGTAEQLGLDMQDGVLRLGLAHYNSMDEVERTLEALRALCAG